MKKVRKIGHTLKRYGFATVLAAAPLAARAADPTDMDGVLTKVSTWQVTAIGIGIALLLFGLGRKVLRKGT